MTFNGYENYYLLKEKYAKNFKNEPNDLNDILNLFSSLEKLVSIEEFIRKDLKHLDKSKELSILISDLKNEQKSFTIIYDLFEKAGFNKDTYLSSKFFCNHKNENKELQTIKIR